jgi:hypothetical protein
MALAGRPPLWMRGAGAGAGAAVAAIAVQAGWSLVRPSWKRTAGSRSRQLRLRNRAPAHVRSLLPEPARRAVSPLCHRPFWPCQVALWHEPGHTRRYLVVRRLASR